MCLKETLYVQVCPPTHGLNPGVRSPRDHEYVNISFTTPIPVTTSSSSADNFLTPINAPHPPTPASTRQFDRHSPCPTDPVATDFHDFPGNGHFSGLSSTMSNASTASGPGSAPAFDPNLKCKGCERQFREGEIQAFKRHSVGCEKLQPHLRHPSPTVEDDVVEEGYTAEQEMDPNLTCIGCGAGFREREIQKFRKHCRSCQPYEQEMARRRAQSTAEKETHTDSTGT